MNIKTTLKASVAAAALFAVAVPVAEAGSISNGNANSVTISGQVNKAFMHHDDGKSTDTAIVDNNNSGTRFRILGSGNISDSVSVGSALEWGFKDNNAAKWTISKPEATFGDTSFASRRAEVFFTHKQFGKLSIGQGPTASDGTAEASFSGAGLAGGGGFNFNDASQIIRTSTDLKNTFGKVTWGSKFSNMDGLSRQDRIRYDTPKFAGFGIATSSISGGASDVSIKYAGKFGSVKVKGAGSYVAHGGNSATLASQWALSAAAEHDSGLNARAQLTQGIKDAVGAKDSQSWAVGAGYDASLSSMGPTSFAVGYFVSENQQNDGDDATQIDFGVVQNIKDAGTELYAGVALLSFDDKGSTSYKDAMSVIAGTRMKF